MKSILEGKKPVEETRKYPYLGIFHDGEVVLFTAKDTGFSVHHPDVFRPHLSECWNESAAESLRGRVVLSND